MKKMFAQKNAEMPTSKRSSYTTLSISVFFAEQLVNEHKTNVKIWDLLSKYTNKMKAYI